MWDQMTTSRWNEFAIILALVTAAAFLISMLPGARRSFPAMLAFYLSGALAGFAMGLLPYPWNLMLMAVFGVASYCWIYEVNPFRMFR